MEFTADSIHYELYDKQGNFIDDRGYYFLEAESESDSILIRLRFPAYQNNYVFNLPYDDFTRIDVHMNKEGKTYTVSTAFGNAVIVVDQYPDSLFNELRGNYNGVLINDEDFSDTMIIEDGSFTYIF